MELLLYILMKLEINVEGVQTEIHSIYCEYEPEQPKICTVKFDEIFKGGFEE